MGVELADDSEGAAHERVDAAVVGVGSGREVVRGVPAERVRRRCAVWPHRRRVGAELSGVELGRGGRGGAWGGGGGAAGGGGVFGGGSVAVLGGGGGGGGTGRVGAGGAGGVGGPGGGYGGR